MADVNGSWADLRLGSDAAFLVFYVPPSPGERETYWRVYPHVPTWTVSRQANGRESMGASLTNARFGPDGVSGKVAGRRGGSYTFAFDVAELTAVLDSAEAWAEIEPRVARGVAFWRDFNSRRASAPPALAANLDVLRDALAKAEQALAVALKAQQGAEIAVRNAQIGVARRKALLEAASPKPAQDQTVNARPSARAGEP